MHFTLVRITTPHMPDTRVFDDVLLPLKFALERLGYKAETRVNSFNADGLNICLGANYDSEQKWIKLPAGTIVFNLEQLEASGYPWLNDGSYLKLLAGFEVWDFSRRNIEFLAEKGLKASFLPLGYVPEMSRLSPCPEPRADALFYGAITPRRRQVLDELDARRLKVLRLDKAFGNERDLALYQAKLLINIHHSLPASLEVVRLAYALANKRAVVSELNPDTYHYPELAEACVYGPHHQLAGLVAELAADGPAREKVAKQGFEAISALRLDKVLGELVGRQAVSGLGADLRTIEERPDCLNLGSGERFLDRALNIDRNPDWRPDLAMTFPDDWSADRTCQTDRFGPVRLAPASFNSILLGRILSDADKHEGVLSVCHELLAERGRLILTLPFRGENNGGQRAEMPGFNENSFQPFIDNGSFELERIEYFWTERGRMMEARGLEWGRRLKAEGAVEAIRIVLIKRGQFISQPDPLKASVGRAEVAPTEKEIRPPWRRIYVFPAPAWVVEETADEAGYRSLGPFPPLSAMRSELIKLYLKKIRYRFNLAFGLSGRHDRYREKLAGVERKISEIKRRLFL